MTKRRTWKGEPIPENLCAAVDEGKITLSAARFEAERSRRVAKAEAKREREIAEWRERQAEEARMAMPWAMFILAHCPARADDVMRGWSIRVVFNEVKESSGCDLGCGHEPLDAEQRAQLKAVCIASGLAEEQADEIVAWNPTLVGATPRRGA